MNWATTIHFLLIIYQLCSYCMVWYFLMNIYYILQYINEYTYIYYLQGQFRVALPSACASRPPGASTQVRHLHPEPPGTVDVALSRLGGVAGAPRAMGMCNCAPGSASFAGTHSGLAAAALSWTRSTIATLHGSSLRPRHDQEPARTEGPGT